MNIQALLVHIESAGWYMGHNVYISGQKAYHRPYDGSGEDDVLSELANTLGSLLRQNLGFKLESSDTDEES